MDIVVKLQDLQAVGDNLKAVQIGDLLVFVIDTSKNIGPSSSGKMLGIGSTGGFASVPGGLKANVYVGKKA